MPKCAKLWALPVHYKDLWKIRAPVQIVEGFDLSHFDQVVMVSNVTRWLDCLFKFWIFKQRKLEGRHSSVVSSSPTILRPGFESQAHHLRFFQFVLLKLLLELEKNKNKQKEDGIGPYFLTTKICPLA